MIAAPSETSVFTRVMLVILRENHLEGLVFTCILFWR
jgi:hypothetical protein